MNFVYSFKWIMTLSKPFSWNSQLFNNITCGSSMINFTQVRRKHEENTDISFMPFRKARLLLYQS